MHIHTAVRRPARALTALLVAGALTAAGCNDFLTGNSEIENDPNRPTNATALQRFAGVQTGLTALLGSDLLRLAGIFTQQFDANGGAYDALEAQYSVSESTTNGFFTGLYTGGGLIDIQRLQQQARDVSDTTLLGISQVQEALLIGTGADVFGDIVYSQAYQGANPAPDEQLAVYDSVQVVLSQAIANLARTGPTNIGPGSVDIVYSGDRAKWARLAHTLKARFYLHTAEVRPAAYAQALAEAEQGITSAADNYAVPFTGSANEENLNFQFNVTQRPGQLTAGRTLFPLLRTRNDPRLTEFFADSATLGEPLTTADAPQVFVTANENLLIIAEAAYRTNNQGRALSALQAAQTLAGVPTAAAGLSGASLLREILTEKYIALFPSIEVWNDYKRTCFPNLAPTASNGRKIPARLFYDALERQTNSSLLAPQDQPARNDNDPANATDPFGNACLGQ